MQCIATDLDAFEAFIGTGPTGAARALGCAYPTYAQYKSGLRVLPRYHAQHILSIMLHDEKTLETYLEISHGIT